MPLKGKLKSSRDDWLDDSESDGDHHNFHDILPPSVPIEIQRAAAAAAAAPLPPPPPPPGAKNWPTLNQVQQTLTEQQSSSIPRHTASPHAPRQAAPGPRRLPPRAQASQVTSAPGHHHPPPAGHHPLPGSGLPSSTSQPSLSSHSSAPRPPSQTQHSPLSPSSPSTPVTTVKALPDISLSSVSFAPESTENIWQVIEDQGGMAKWRERYLGGPDSTLRDMSKEDQEYMTPVKPQGAGLGYGKYSGPPVRDISTLTLSELKNMKISDIFPTADEVSDPGALFPLSS
jgi:hypothetical protein